MQMPFLKGDLEIMASLREVIESEDVILNISHVSERRFIYMDPIVEHKLGYGPDYFLENPIDCFFEIILPDDIPKIMQRQVSYAKNLLKDPYAIIIQEFPHSFITGWREIVPCVGLAVVLTFDEQTIVGHSIGISCFNLAEEKILKYRRLLEKIKLYHNRIFAHPPFNFKSSPLNLVYVTSNRSDQCISMREKEVLLLLATGRSTREIAKELSISEHTVETHRKHLLEKLGAKNTAQLIKKASKIFWLE